jgi:peptidoglycan/xylan/chitin deacetylase (PgdA/CDA1 family)
MQWMLKSLSSPSAFARRALLLSWLGSVVCIRVAAGANLLEKSNPGFEDGLAGWTPDPLVDAMFQVSSEAASMGAKGLRAGSAGEGDNTKAALAGPRVPVTAGHTYRLTFWAGTYGGLNTTAQLAFFGADGAILQGVKSPGYWNGSLINEQGSNAPFLFQAVAPEGAVSAGVMLGVLVKSKGYSDIDDFDLEEVRPDPPGTKSDHLPLLDVAPLLAEVKADPYRGQPEPKIVIKIDDLTGSALDKWKRITDFTTGKKIKVGIGIIAKSLDTDRPAYFDWITKLHDTGLVEFWFHGWDHANWTSPDGKSHGEFNDRTYDEQKKRFDDAERLAKEKLGFPFEAFGPPSGSWDAVTLQVMQNEPDIKTYIYGIPGQDGGKIPLVRVGCVNLEYPTFIPRYDRFVAGYVHNRGRPYFVLQGHPWHWNDKDFGEVVKIIDFLSDQGVTFVTPSELGAQLAAAPKTALTSSPVAAP